MCNRVTLEYKLAELEQHHQKLDESIKRGYTSYLDDAHLSKMKQEKLFIKRQIEELKVKLADPILDILR